MRHLPVRELLPAVEVSGQTVGAGTITGKGVDLLGWDSVAFIAEVAACVGSGTLDMYVEESENSNFTGAVNVTNAAIVQVAGANAANTVHVLELGQLENRYVRVKAVVAVNNVNFAVLSVRGRHQGRGPASWGTYDTYLSFIGENN